MGNNGAPAVPKIQDIYFTEDGKIRVDIQDIDKIYKILTLSSWIMPSTLKVGLRSIWSEPRV
ncbi:hypothetical protein NHP190012_11960 [Helicobacter sp. NHP19-012]|uniref:Uncharacterized protein n=1 Tax=Helicobacter gastrofelis TaxID=2849642 RepID=A0ABM7SFC2_9HELI|nr:hypothetical protein NHP190012_11960 [Helicobacter sp. NHP19-012]GMB96719.1 hypothetical protein NHP22001_13080 [Helicobacter sp. NHP22-001]